MVDWAISAPQETLRTNSAGEPESLEPVCRTDHQWWMNVATTQLQLAKESRKSRENPKMRGE
jgi:hypothetical protein